MKKATLTETKNNLSALLDRVRQGQGIVIEDRGVPVARLEPVVTAGGAAEGRAARLERQGTLRRGGGEALPRSFFTDRLPRPSKAVTASGALMDERRDGP